MTLGHLILTAGAWGGLWPPHWQRCVQLIEGKRSVTARALFTATCRLPSLNSGAAASHLRPHPPSWFIQCAPSCHCGQSSGKILPLSLVIKVLVTFLTNQRRNQGRFGKGVVFGIRQMFSVFSLLPVSKHVGKSVPRCWRRADGVALETKAEEGGAGRPVGHPC